MSDRNDLEILSPEQVMPADSLAVSLTKAEIDQQISTARAYPRSLKRAVNAIMTLATLDAETAQSCIYALPRGGKPITGPSARFAEIVFSQWGNCRVASRTINVDKTDKFVEAEGLYHDLETNAARRAVVRRSIRDKQGRVFSDDMITVTGNAAASIASRNAILAGVPRAVWGQAFERCQHVLKGDVKTLTETIVDTMKAFAAFGVTPEQVCAAIALEGTADIKLDHIPLLRGMYGTLKNGEATVEEMFPQAVAAKPVATKTAASATEAAPVTAKPVPPKPPTPPTPPGAAA